MIDKAPEAERELLPCPFCGNDEISVSHDEDRDQYYVGCLDCCATVAAGAEHDKDAIAAWNRRAQPPVEALDDYRLIAHLLGIIYMAGDFVAETANERQIEALLIKTGHRYRTWAEVDALHETTPPASVPQAEASGETHCTLTDEELADPEFVRAYIEGQYDSFATQCEEIKRLRAAIAILTQGEAT